MKKNSFLLKFKKKFTFTKMEFMKKLTDVNGLLALLFVITMILRPIAMTTTAKNMEDKDGASKAMPMYITITVLGIVSVLIFLFGDKIPIPQIKGKEKMIALGAVLIAVLLQIGSMGALKAANASVAEYTNALFDLISMGVVFAILVFMYLGGSKSSEEVANAAAFGHFYY
jgi:hypothetical protein